MKRSKIKKALKKGKKLIWKDPNFIVGNDYIITKLIDLNKESCKIIYNGGDSFAEVPLHEISVFKPSVFKYRIGNIILQGTNINELKDLSELMGELAMKSGEDLPKHLNDACFDIDLDYQTYYNLDGDDWSKIH